MTRPLALLGVIVGLLSVSGCDITDMNVNPNEPTQPTTGYILSDAQVDIADTYWDDFNAGRFGLLYAQYWTQNQYTDEDRYQYREAIVNDYWSSLYLALNNLEEIKRLVSATPESYVSPENQIAAATVMQVFAWQLLTDIYGDIPYTEALQGAVNRSPAYTPQEEIYSDLIEQLTDAQAAFDLSGTVPGDLIYGGDPLQWKQFANSLKMRVAIRMSDRMPAAAATAIQEALAAGVMTDVSDSATLNFQSALPYSNPFWENYNIAGRDDWAVTDGLVDLLLENDDPRLPIYVAPTPASVTVGDPVYVGLPYGLEGGVAAATPRASFSRPGAAVISQTAPALFMLYDEVLFIMAEAAVRGFIPGNADALFEAAVAASMEYWGVNAPAEVASYVAALPNLTPANYEQVLGEQKWLALYMQGIQGWSEWRRLDFTGVLIPPVGGKRDEFDGPIAVRYVYPEQEENLNAENLAAAIASQGSDTQGTPVWWDETVIGR